MIDRYSITASTQELSKRFDVEIPEFYRPRYNAAPAQLLPVLLLYSKGLSFFYWGESPQWVKDKSISEKWINVRAEQFRDKPILQKSLKKQRCLIPADGFYLWKRVSKKSLIPYRYTLKTKSIFSIPGLWEEYDDDNGEIVHTFTLITCATSELATERIPAIFDSSAEKQWMNPNSTEEELLSLLKVYDLNKLESYTVEPRISSMTADDKSLILPAPPADQFGNLTLFD